MTECSVINDKLEDSNAVYMESLLVINLIKCPFILQSADPHFISTDTCCNSLMVCLSN